MEGQTGSPGRAGEVLDPKRQQMAVQKWPQLGAWNARLIFLFVCVSLVFGCDASDQDSDSLEIETSDFEDEVSRSYGAAE